MKPQDYKNLVENIIPDFKIICGTTDIYGLGRLINISVRGDLCFLSEDWLGLEQDFINISPLDMILKHPMEMKLISKEYIQNKFLSENEENNYDLFKHNGTSYMVVKCSNDGIELIREDDMTPTKHGKVVDLMKLFTVDPLTLLCKLDLNTLDTLNFRKK